MLDFLRLVCLQAVFAGSLLLLVAQQSLWVLLDTILMIILIESHHDQLIVTVFYCDP